MGRFWDSSWGMICAGFLSPVDRADLTALARDGSAAHRLARRANALVLLDSGWSCEKVAGALLLDDDTIRRWHGLFIEDGLEGLTRFEAGGSACQMNGEQKENLKAWVAAALPRSTRQIGAWIEQEFGHVYAGRSGLIALLHRLGLEYHKPKVIPRKLDEEKQKAFIANYEKVLNSLPDDEAVLFADAGHPTHAARAPEPAPPRARADEWAPAHQLPWRGRSRDGSNPNDRGRNRRRCLDDQASGIDRGVLSDAGPHPCLSRQRALSSREDRAGMARSAGAANKAALHPAILPASEPDRAAMGRDAQACHAQ